MDADELRRLHYCLALTPAERLTLHYAHRLEHAAKRALARQMKNVPTHGQIRDRERLLDHFGGPLVQLTVCGQIAPQYH